MPKNPPDDITRMTSPGWLFLAMYSTISSTLRDINRLATGVLNILNNPIRIEPFLKGDIVRREQSRENGDIRMFETRRNTSPEKYCGAKSPNAAQTLPTPDHSAKRF